MYESICVIFGRLRRYFVVNTSVNFIMNRFITKVAPSSNKINNSVFHLQNHVRPLYLVHFYKILALVFPNFGKLQQHDILNVSINFIFTKCLYKVMPLGKKNKLLFSYYKRLKMNFFSFLASWLSPNAIKN